MPYLKGSDIQIGVGREATRGTYQAPSIWVPGRTPAGIHVQVDKTQIKETTGQGVGTTGSIVVQKRAEGSLELNLRSNSIGYFLLSLFGKVTTTTLETGVYQHVFEILTGNPQFPTLSLGLSQLGQQDYKYLRTLVTHMSMKNNVTDLINATFDFLAGSEATVTDYTPSFATSDLFFRPFDATFKLADVVANLGAASAAAVKEIDLDIKNNGRLNQNISDGVTASDAFGILHEVTGSISADYDGETNHDAYAAGTYQAASLTFLRSDVTIGVTHNPSLAFVMPKISLEKYSPDRPIDDIVKEGIDFTAHFDTSAGYALKATLINTNASYAT